MKKISFLSKIKTWISSHKIISLVILVIIIGSGYYTYAHFKTSNSVTQYTLSPARIGTITQTVTGSGQVSAENQLEIASEVSGTVLSINTSVGQSVKAGSLIATLDSSDAAIDLENARISLAKLTQSAKPGELVSSQNTVTKTYSDGFSTISESFLGLPTVMDGFYDLLYSRDGYLSDQQVISLSAVSRQYRNTAGTSYDKANKQYEILLKEYKSLARTSASSSIEMLIADTIDLNKMISSALKDAQNAITFITTNESDYKADAAETSASDVSSWSTTVNGMLTDLLSAKNSIHTAVNDLQDLITGTDELDIQSQELSVQQKLKTYQKYFIRAPFDGIIGKISVNIYDKASSGTSIATLVSTRRIASISLNEVDAAKVRVGQPVTVTFDAIDDLTATGTVTQVDQVGSVSSGVVSYGVKIMIDTVDERIKPGMSMNVTITTEEKSGVLVVPSNAVKTKNGSKYVEVITETGQSTMQTASTSSRTGRASGSLTVSSKTAPLQVMVTVGSSDDSYTEITDGLTAGSMVVTKTTTGVSAQTTAPSILNSLTPQRSRSTTSSSSSSKSSSSGSNSSSAPSGPPPGAF